MENLLNYVLLLSVRRHVELEATTVSENYVPGNERKGCPR